MTFCNWVCVGMFWEKTLGDPWNKDQALTTPCVLRTTRSPEITYEGCLLNEHFHGKGRVHGPEFETECEWKDGVGMGHQIMRKTVSNGGQETVIQLHFAGKYRRFRYVCAFCLSCFCFVLCVLFVFRRRGTCVLAVQFPSLCCPYFHRPLNSQRLLAHARTLLAYLI
jgi:hypothetical protein